MSAFTDRRFGAFVDPNRVYAIEYRRVPTGIAVVEHMSVERSMPTIEDAAEALVDLIRLSVAVPDEARVTAAIRGFGISYHLMTLPPAGADVLTPVIDREMRRLFPDIDDPLVAFAVGGHIDRRTGKPAASPEERGLSERRGTAPAGETLPLEILAAAAPRQVVDTLVTTLAREDIRLDHLTVLPQAMARLYREVDGTGDPAALAIMLQGSPVIGVFEGGDVKFISEPPPSEEGLSAIDIQTVIDQVGRARMYLRQNFRGADIAKIFVAAVPSDQGHVDAVLNSALNVEVVPLAPTMGPPAAVAALGSVLNAETGSEMVLHPSPREMFRALEKRRMRRWTLAAAAVALLAIAVAAFTTVAASRAAGELEAARAAADAEMARIASAMGVIEQRRANLQRITAMQTHYAERQHLARLVNGIRLAQPVNVSLTGATLTRTPQGWLVAISGTANGPTGADVLEGVAEFSRELPARIPLQSFKLESFEYSDSTEEIAGNFRVSFMSAAIR